MEPTGDANVIDAAARGAGEGLKLAANVAAMLLAFIALVEMLNHVLAFPAMQHNAPLWQQVSATLASAGHALPQGCDDPRSATALTRCIEQGVTLTGAAAPDVWHPWTLERVLGWVFWPFAFVMGIAPSECTYAGQLLGEKIVLNELVAYSHFGEAVHGGMQLSVRTKVILSYALCGFANLGSIAILIGGIGGLAPERRHEISRLGLRAVLAGSLAAFMTACVAGVLL
jgi:CNT family concentrative nucleoside transporter